MKRKTPSQKGPKEVTKIDASGVKNLDTELDQPSVDTPSKRQRGKYVLIHPKSLFLHSLTILHELFFRKKRAFQPLVTEPLCPGKKERIGGCRKKRSVLTVFGSV